MAFCKILIAKSSITCLNLNTYILLCSATESLLEPLRAQLDDLDQVVQNQLDANSALKSSIARNDERIQRMLSSVNHKS